VRLRLTSFGSSGSGGLTLTLTVESDDAEAFDPTKRRRKTRG
jgi:hypothetical protein